MATGTDFLPVATGAGANVDTQANFSGSGYQTGGMTAGTAQSVQANKCWRQATMWSAAWANFMSNTLGVYIYDDGNLAALVTLIGNALSAIITAALAGINASITTLTTKVNGFNRVDNANGSYIEFPDGSFVMWGMVGLAGGGTQTVAITFPHAFTTTVGLSIHTTPLSARDNIVTCVPSRTTGGFVASITGCVLIGGSGSNPDGSEQIMWEAKGR
jgi:hypothetical protein